MTIQIPARTKLPLTVLCLAVILGAGLSAFYTYRQTNSPGSTEAQKGDNDLAQQRFPEAVAAFTAATKLAPNDGALFARLYRAELAVNNGPAARAAAKRAYDLLPQDGDAAGLYGLLEKKYGGRDTVLTALRQAHRLKPEDADYLHGLVQIEMTMLSLADAERDLAPWLKTHPDDPTANHLMAILLDQKAGSGNLQAALEDERKAHAASPNDLAITNELGDIYLKLDRPQDAAETFGEGLKLDPYSAKMLNGVVRAYQKMGNLPGATAAAGKLAAVEATRQRITHLGDALSINPANVAAGTELALLDEKVGDSQSAYQVLTKLVRAAPADATSRRALSDFYRRHDRPGLAEDALRPSYLP